MANSGGKFNVRNPAVKRIMQEIKELQAETCPDFIADALEEDIFEWHFVIRGPPDTEFEGGIYHGRILLPAEYPFKPPAFMMLTPNGRFQTGMKICLSISSHHPEHWQPSWSVRTALTALIAFMPSPGQGAIGSLDFTKEERMQMAVKSRTDMPKFGSAARQKVIADMHSRFIKLQEQLAAAGSSSSTGSSSGSAPQSPAAAAPAKESVVRDVLQPTEVASADQKVAVQDSRGTSGEQLKVQQPVFSLQQQQRGLTSPQVSAGGSSELMSHLHHRAGAQQQQSQQQQQAQAPAMLQQQVAMTAPGLGHAGVSDLPADRGLTFLIVVLSVAIAAMLLKKVVVAFGVVGVQHPML